MQPVVVLVLMCVGAALCVHEQGFVHVAETDGDMPSSKYTATTVKQIKRAAGELFESADIVPSNNGTCDHNVHVLWSAQVGSSVFATPSIVDLHSDGRKEILIPTYTQYVEALDGSTGGDTQGFPFAHPQFRSHSGAVPIDLDADGSLEWMIATFTGELIFLSEDGRAVPGRTIKIPPLPVKRDWRKKNLAADQAAKSTVNTPRPAPTFEAFMIRQRQNAVVQQQRRPLVRTADPLPHLANEPIELEHHQPDDKPKDLLQPAASNPPQGDKQPAVTETPKTGLTLQQLDDPLPGDGDQSMPDSQHGADALHYEDYGGYMDDDYPYHEAVPLETEGPRSIGTDGWLSAEAKASMDLVFHPELFKSMANVEPEHDPFSIYAMQQSGNTVVVQSDEIAVDAHVLSTPIIVDTDMDGHLDVVVHVTYFFDAQHYDKPENTDSLPKDVDTDDFVASAIVVMDVITGAVKWQQVLHLTTKHVSHPAYAFSSPYVVNINQGILMDIFVATPLGYLAGFDGNGRALAGWPVHMAPIVGSPVSDDLNGDGKLDLCAGDVKGNVACFDAHGKELWHTVVGGAVTDSPMLGDVNGDTFLDVVVGTSLGGIYALDGRSGKVLPFFPVLADGAVMAPPLLLNLNSSEAKGLHIVVPSLDGFLYIISGTTGCFELIDLGEKSYSMVLADDLTGNGLMDLVVTTISGGVTVFETKTPFHPLKAWPRRLKSFNGATANEGHLGVFFEKQSRFHRDIRGDRFKMLVNIRDDRPHQTGFRIYTIIVFAGTHIILGMRKSLEAKAISLELPCPAQRMYTTLRVVMVTNEGLVFEDSVAVSFNMHFLETIKYLVVVPFLLTCLALWFVRKEHTVKAPKIVYRRGRLVLDEDYYNY